MQSIKIENKEYVIIKKDEYEALKLVKDEELFPSCVVDDIVLNNINPIKVYRKHRELTITKLAKTVGVSQSYISDIENNKKDGSIQIIKKIATALKVDIDMIV